VLDEPTNHLDIRHQLEVLDLVRRLGISTLAALPRSESSGRILRSALRSVGGFYRCGGHTGCRAHGRSLSRMSLASEPLVQCILSPDACSCHSSQQSPGIRDLRSRPTADSVVPVCLDRGERATTLASSFAPRSVTRSGTAIRHRRLLSSGTGARARYQ
jgi:hypothetical protein